MIYVAFDIDGTLYDCSSIVGEAFNKGIEDVAKLKTEYLLRKPTTQEIMKLVGMPVDEIFESLFPALSRGLIQQLNDSCTYRLSQMVLEKKGEILPGAAETIPALYAKGYRLLTASNGRKEYVQAVLDAYELSPCFVSITALEDLNLDDKTQLLAHYKKSLPNVEMLIMIGDRTNDMMAAQNNDLPFIACAFGHNDDEIAHCTWIAHSIYDIPALVEAVIAEKDRRTS